MHCNYIQYIIYTLGRCINNKYIKLTMTNKVKTINLQGKEYAQVKDRIKAFREDCPNGKIETTPTVTGNNVVFKAYVIKDKNKAESADATGHSFGENAKGAKAFEKLETISIGRALANLGYLIDGEIASSEEMEDYNQWKDERRFELISALQTEVDKIENLEELRVLYKNNRGMGKEVDELLTAKAKELKSK